MNAARKHPYRTGLAGLVAAMSLVALAATPASAVVVDNDRPKITETDWDFGYNWVLGAPVNGGNLDWDITSGLVTPDLEGYLYMKNTSGDCGRVHIEYYDADHVMLDDEASDWEAGSTNKIQYFVNEENFSHADITHVHIHIDADRGCNGTWSAVGEVTRDLMD